MRLVGYAHHFLLYVLYVLYVFFICFLLLWTMTWIHGPVFAQWISPIVGYILSCSVWLMDNVVENATVFVWGFFFTWFLQNIVLSPFTKSNATLCFTQCTILNLSACVPVCAYVHLPVSTHPCTYGSQKLISGVWFHKFPPSLLVVVLRQVLLLIMGPVCWDLLAAVSLHIVC